MVGSGFRGLRAQTAYIRRGIAARSAAVTLALSLCAATMATGCKAVPGGVLVPAGVFGRTDVLIGFPTLDGSWVLADVSGRRSCLVVQESRVSIVDATCSSDGRGLAARVAPDSTISKSGDTIVLRVTYTPRIYETATEHFSFTGQIQADGTYKGIRRDSDSDAPDGFVETAAVLSRP